MDAEESQYQQLIAQRQQIESGISEIDSQITQVLSQEIYSYLNNNGYSYSEISQLKIQSSIFTIEFKISPYQVNFLITLASNQSNPSPTLLPSDNVLVEIEKPKPTPTAGGKGSRISSLFRQRKTWEPMNQSFDIFFPSNLSQYFVQNNQAALA